MANKLWIWVISLIVIGIMFIGYSTLVEYDANYGTLEALVGLIMLVSSICTYAEITMPVRGFKSQQKPIIYEKDFDNIQSTENF